MISRGENKCNKCGKWTLGKNYYDNDNGKVYYCNRLICQIFAELKAKALILPRLPYLDPIINVDVSQGKDRSVSVVAEIIPPAKHITLDIEI